MILRGRFLAALARINPHLPPEALEQVAHAVKNSTDFDIPIHSAILDEPAKPAEKQSKGNRLLALNIRPIWYPHGNHAMAEKLLRLALDCAKGRVSV